MAPTQTNSLVPTLLSVVLGWMIVREQWVFVSADHLALSGVLSMGFNVAIDQSSGNDVKCNPEQLHRVNREIFMVIAQQAGVPYDVATDVNSWAWMSDVEVQLDLIEEECKLEHGRHDDGGRDSNAMDWDHLRNGFLGEDIICPLDNDGKDTRRRRTAARALFAAEEEEEELEEESLLLPDDQKERKLPGCYNCVSIGVNWYDCIGCYGRRRRELRTRKLSEMELSSLRTVGTAICFAINDGARGHDSGIPCMDCSSFQVMLV